MKQKLKKTLLLYLFFGTLFVSCSVEKDFDDQIVKYKNIKVTHKKFEVLIKDKKFSKTLNEVITIKNNNSLNKKSIMEDLYGFTISTLPINIIENNEITSYTLFVTRENNPIMYWKI